jgi:hypothetical protein
MMVHLGLCSSCHWDGDVIDNETSYCKKLFSWEIVMACDGLLKQVIKWRARMEGLVTVWWAVGGGRRYIGKSK